VHDDASPGNLIGTFRRNVLAFLLDRQLSKDQGNTFLRNGGVRVSSDASHVTYRNGNIDIKITSCTYELQSNNEMPIEGGIARHNNSS
jgi:hypothetical protein